jgi:hypothetical protein
MVWPKHLRSGAESRLNTLENSLMTTPSLRCLNHAIYFQVQALGPDGTCTWDLTYPTYLGLLVPISTYWVGVPYLFYL